MYAASEALGARIAVKDDPHKPGVAAAFDQGSARSKLGRWMARNYDWFTGQIELHGANWSALTDAFKAEGLMPQDARTETAKRTWQRVQSRTRSSKPPTTQPPPTKSTPQAEQSSDTAFDFSGAKPATFRK